MTLRADARGGATTRTNHIDRNNGVVLADNFRVDITSEGVPSLRLALDLFFKKSGYVRGWREDVKDGKPRLVLAWTPVKDKVGWHPFPTSLDSEGVVDLIVRWLEMTDYGPAPGHDGSNGHGWRVYNEAWGHVEPYGHDALVAIEPAWAMYGK